MFKVNPLQLPRGVRPLARSCLLGGVLFSPLSLVQQDCSSDTGLEGLVVTTDYSSAVIRIMEPATGKIVFDYDIRAAHPEYCYGDLSPLCSVMGMEHRYVDGENYLDFNAMFPEPDGEVFSVVRRIKIADPVEQIWSIERLNYDGVADSEVYCPAAEREGGTCRFGSIIGLEVTADDAREERVTAIVTDDQRILQVTLNYAGGNTTGVVDWVLGPQHEGWPVFGYPNTVTYLADEPGGPYMLSTFVVTEAGTDYSGKIYLWRWTGAQWDVAWRFPEEGYLYYPHMAELQVEPLTGERRIYYNHSSGNSAGGSEGVPVGGTFGVLIPGEPLFEPPTYYFEAVYHLESDALRTGFTHDIDVLEDGTMLLTEAPFTFSAVNPGGRVSHVDAFLEPPRDAAPKSGAYDPNSLTQTLLEMPAESIHAEYSCQYRSIYESEFVPWEQVGAFLHQAAELSVTYCDGRTTGATRDDAHLSGAL